MATTTSTMEELRGVIARNFEIPLDKVTPDSRLLLDHGLDSLDHVELIMECEARWGIEIDDTAAEGWYSGDSTVRGLAEAIDNMLAARRDMGGDRG